MQNALKASLAVLAASLLASPALAGPYDTRPSGAPKYTAETHFEHNTITGNNLPERGEARRAYMQEREALLGKYLELEAANGGKLDREQALAMQADIAALKTAYGIR